MTKIAYYKNRTIDETRPVQVYRNLNKKGYRWSVRQSGLVVAHANSIYLKGCKFVVNERGRLWVLRNNIKTVHAYVEGWYQANRPRVKFVQPVFYNPYAYKSFMIFDYFFYGQGRKINNARFVWLGDNVMFYGKL
jgi:hypothetical protein